MLRFLIVCNTVHRGSVFACWPADCLGMFLHMSTSLPSFSFSLPIFCPSVSWSTDLCRPTRWTSTTCHLLCSNWDVLLLWCFAFRYFAHYKIVHPIEPVIIGRPHWFWCVLVRKPNCTEPKPQFFPQNWTETDRLPPLWHCNNANVYKAYCLAQYSRLVRLTCALIISKISV